MNGVWTLYLDQYGHAIGARTVKELRQKAGGGRVSKMYRDTKQGTKQVGYVVGRHWFDAYRPLELEP